MSRYVFSAAVAQVSNLLYRRLAACVALDKAYGPGFGLSQAECNSAIQKTGSLRYAFGQILKQ